MDKATLYINGKIYEGWKDVDIKRSLKAASGSFSLSITDRWSGQQQPWIIAPGDTAEILIGKDKVISGYVDSVSAEIESGDRAITVAGRDKTSDIIDCSVESKTGEYSNVTLQSLASMLCAPFGVTVIAPATGTGSRFDVFKIQQGETVFEALERAARKRGFLLTSDGMGSLVITTPGSERSTTRLELGQNIKRIASTFDHKNRFSKYIVKGQSTGFSADGTPAVDYAAKGIATDENVKRNRPLVVQSEQLTNTADAKRRANWEAAVRGAKAASFTVVLQGWRQGDGSLWRPNQLVLCYAAAIGLDGEMLVTDVSYTLANGQGSITTLSLERKDAYRVEESVVREKTDPLVQAIKKDPGFRKARQ